ncbi:hypothetical protein RRG08_066946 [Elysia crispata]|uniref:Uncharacterized protein n=1 Tax=Elysia crispata TaxID=231223 RepID=A0AAE1E2M3_9GAST|nr:hypothetical protein RRG08_066946 [Elysia crispata]
MNVILTITEKINNIDSISWDSIFALYSPAKGGGWSAKQKQDGGPGHSGQQNRSKMADLAIVWSAKQKQDGGSGHSGQQNRSKMADLAIVVSKTEARWRIWRDKNTRMRRGRDELCARLSSGRQGETDPRKHVISVAQESRSVMTISELQNSLPELLSRC